MICYLVRLNGVPRYVGITVCSLAKRWREHKSSAVRGSKTYLANSIRAHGFENFTIEMIGTAETTDALRQLERDMITTHGTKTPNGCNLTDGGDGIFGYKFPRELVDRLRAERTGIKRGPHSPEWCKAISDGKRASTKVRTLEWVPAMAAKLRAAGLAPNLGKKASTETRQKMSEAAKARDPATRKAKTKLTRRPLSDETKQKITNTNKTRWVERCAAGWVPPKLDASPEAKAQRSKRAQLREASRTPEQRSESARAREAKKRDARAIAKLQLVDPSNEQREQATDLDSTG